MPKFYYRAKKGPTEIIEDVIDAADSDEAVEKINRLGYLPVAIEEDALRKPSDQKTAPSKISSFAGVRVRPQEVTIFSRQLASLTKSGVPILRALSIIAEQSESPSFKKVLSSIGTDVKEGKSFSSSLEVWPSVFPSFYVAMVRSGENSGTLQEALLRIAFYRQKQEEMLSKVRAAMAYPLLMGLVGIGTVIFMFTFVLPKLTAIFSNMGEASLPASTKIVIAASVFLKTKWPILVGVMAGLYILLVRSSNYKARKKLVSVLALHIPFFNRFYLYNELARFARTLEILIKSGIPILRAIDISIPILSNEIIKRDLKRSAVELEQGAAFGKSLKKSKFFPPFMISLITVGEESGKLDEALAEIAEAYEHDCDEAVKVMTSLLEPAMILVMGLMIGFIVMAMLLPIFQINMMVK